jgi:L-amino acid N-acyltransferase YncA
MIVREPTLDDVPELFDCLIHYAAEARQAKEVPVVREMARQSLLNVICADNFVKRVAVVDGKIGAIAFGYFAASWWNEPDCAIDMFYVGKECRGTRASRELVASMIAAFKAQGCGWMYAAAETDVSAKNSRIYENLFKKFGFRDIGGGRMILNLRGL